MITLHSISLKKIPFYHMKWIKREVKEEEEEKEKRKKNQKRCIWTLKVEGNDESIWSHAIRINI